MQTEITLISHALCPYVQRAAIALAEKGVSFTRRTVDLQKKPDWFLEISPLRKTPVLQVGRTALFESAAILEYLEETQANPLHPADPLVRARHRAWIEFGSGTLSDIAGFYSARDSAAFGAKTAALRARFELLERQLSEGPYFAENDFSLVDVVFAPVFRYFDVFDQIADFGILTDLARTRRWRDALAARPSVIGAVDASYPEHLARFIEHRGSHLSGLLREKAA
jgi:glutathione S-transferase